MTASDYLSTYDYEAFLAERSVRRNEQRKAARAEAAQPFTEYDAMLESLAASEPPLDAEEQEAEEARVLDLRSYPETWRPFVHRPHNGDWGASA